MKIYELIQKLEEVGDKNAEVYVWEGYQPYEEYIDNFEVRHKVVDSDDKGVIIEVTLD